MPFNAVAATNDFATAKYKGVQGNNITIVIQANVDEPTLSMADKACVIASL
ncbi:hypothetical protein [Lysinibacillus fusiformis]|uniref:hypothetical protein n=1 Tax=Lysinibacillus fusiformis TaxID=28031 RepID=UPI000ABF2574|nr:hypothetical protein [Lysinibacillus fusiformis]